MTYKFVIHPVDLQDHDGFLSFLSHYAGQGYQAVQIHRSFTLFRGRARLWNDEDSVVEPWNGLQPVCKAVFPGAKRHAVLCRRGVRPAKEGE